MHTQKMFNNQKVVVTMTSWTKRIGNCVKVIQSILENTVIPDIVFLNLSIEEFPNRLNDLPKDLVELSLKNPKVKIGWDYDIDTLFQNEKVISIEDNECSDTKFIEKQLSSIEGRQTLDMTMISVFYDAGINELRKVATRKAVSHWMEQQNLPKEMMFIELGFNGVFTFSQEDFPKEINYIRIDGDDSNKYLFQKEHLWNIAAKRAKYEKLMFVDSDIAPLNDVDWFKEVYLALDKCLFTQGFCTITYLDNNDKLTSRKLGSYTYSVTTNDIKLNNCVPGGVYCISKTTLQMIGYFNYLPFGGGDNLFWSEIADLNSFYPWFLLYRRKYVQEVIQIAIKVFNRNILGNVFIDVYHFYHGERLGRSYQQRHYMMLTQFPLENRLITCGGNGLLQWINVNSFGYNIFSRLHEVNNDVYRASYLFNGKFDYIGFYNEMSQIVNKKHYMKQCTFYDMINILRKMNIKYSL